MANEFTKSNNIKPAVLGQIANPDDYNQNIAGQSKDAIVGIDQNGSFADVDLGDESLIANGALIKDIKLREGFNLKFYNASGVFQRNVNLGIASTTLGGQVYLTNPITISHNVSDPDHDLDFTAGNFRFFDGSGQSTFDAQTGSIDDLFGTGTGMLDTGTVANTTPYYLYPVYNPTTGDSKILATATKDSPTMTLPDADGYTVLGRRIGSLFTDASANIVPAKWIYEDSQYYVRYNNSIIDLNTASPATTRTALSISAPAGTQVELGCTLFDNDTATTYVLFTEENQTDAPSLTNSDISANDQGRQSGTVFRFLNSSSQVYYQSTDGALAANGLTVRVRGYRDKL